MELTDGVFAGPYGTATRLPIDDDPQRRFTVSWWLVDAPGQSPMWTQYLLCAVRLTGESDPPAKLQFDGATHELFLMALHPDTPVRPADVLAPGFELRWLSPINFVHQFTATDDEIVQMMALAAWAITAGVNPAEPSLGYRSFREWWLSSLVKTLAHIRGEEHAS